MIYKVRARFKTATSAAFLDRLTDGSVAGQRPDGAEIVASMNRAVVTASGYVEWSERCYCPTPLHHERQTVLDDHFDTISTEVIDEIQHYDGQPFMNYLKQLADRTP